MEFLSRLRSFRKEPAVLLALAAAVLVVGVDLLEVSATIERLVSLASVLGITGFGTRSQVYAPDTVDHDYVRKEG